MTLNAWANRPGPVALMSGDTSFQNQSSTAACGGAGAAAVSDSICGKRLDCDDTCTLMRFPAPLEGTPTRLKVKSG